MEQEIDRFCRANIELLAKIKEYEETINDFELDLCSKKSSIQQNEDNENIRYLEEYIDKLQLRIVKQTKIYEEEKLNNAERVSTLQEKITKLEECEELGKIYKEKYDEIMDQMQKMNIWKK